MTMRSSTDIQVSKWVYTWTLKNLSWISTAVKELKSPTLSAVDSADIDGSKWCLRFDMSDKEYMKLYLQLQSSNKSEVTARFKINTLNFKGKESIMIQHQGIETYITKEKPEKFVGRIQKKFVNEVEDTITIFCQVGVAGEIRQSDILRLPEPESRFCEDFGNMFASEKFSDVTIAAAGREYRAHKNILAARSEVFAAMFEHEMEERQQNRVDITDVDPDVLGDMLRFVYTGKAPTLEKMTFDLLAAADKYALKKLEEMCERALCVKLSVEKAAEMLILADFYSAGQLKGEAINFINTHYTDVMKTQGWQNMMTTHSHLLLEAYQQALASLEATERGDKFNTCTSPEPYE